MDGSAFTQWECPQCGYVETSSNDDLPPPAFYRPWHVRGPKALAAYLESLGFEAREWLLALYVDKELNLLAVDTIARGGVDSCEIPYWKLFSRGHQLKARGFILAHNHPSGDDRPSDSDHRATARIARLADDLEMPLIDHVIVTKNGIRSMRMSGLR